MISKTYDKSLEFGVDFSYLSHKNQKGLCIRCILMKKIGNNFSHKLSAKLRFESFA